MSLFQHIVGYQIVPVDQVNELLKEGWQPFGSPCLTMQHSATAIMDQPSAVLMQAMVMIQYVKPEKRPADG